MSRHRMIIHVAFTIVSYWYTFVLSRTLFVLRLPLMALFMLVALGTNFVPTTSIAAVSHNGIGALRQKLQDIQLQHNIPVLAVSLIGGQSTHNLSPCETQSISHEYILLGGSANQQLRWGSITKTVTALTTLALVRDGHFNLQSKLADLIDKKQWHNPWHKRHPIKVIHLLEMTAGFTDLSGLEFNYLDPISLDAALKLNPKGRQVHWPPGLQHIYSNLTPGLTQLLIETVTQKEYGQVVAEKVFGPLGMQQANFSATADLPGGWKADGKTPIPYWHMIFPAFGAMNASIEDLTKLTKLLIHNNQQSHQTKTQNHSASACAENLSYRKFLNTDNFTNSSDLAARHGLKHGYGLGIYQRVRQGFIWQTHGGDADGYRSRMAILDDHSRGYVVNINVDNPRVLRRIEGLLETYLTTGLPTKPGKQKTAQDKFPNQALCADPHLSAYTGHYYPSGVRFGLQQWQQGSGTILRIEQSDHCVLQVKRGPRSTPLITLGEGLFRRDTDPHATIAFIKHRDNIYFQGELGNFMKCPEGKSPCPGEINGALKKY